MPNQTSLRGGEKKIQDWISLACGVLLFISPWPLVFVFDVRAAITVWVAGIMIAAIAVAALVQFAEWEAWALLVAGLATAASPWALGFYVLHRGLAVCVVLGLIVALASAAKIWSLRHPAAIARR
jgi:hypothetical protein